jgi:glucose/arabinose dehydrogenase
MKSARRSRLGPRVLFLAPTAVLLLVAILSPGGCSSQGTIAGTGGGSSSATSGPGPGPGPGPGATTVSSSSGGMPDGSDDGDGGHDAPEEVVMVDATPGPSFCTLPGSLVYNVDGGVDEVGGGPPSPDLSWLTVPPGFCVHYYGNVPYARQVRFAPGGELFVSSPSTGTTGGGGNGMAAIVVLPDDNGDGYADSVGQFLGDLPSTQGLLFTPGYFYYQDGTMIRRLPYTTGERVGPGPGTVVVDISMANGDYVDTGHWPKTLDQADDGTLYVGNGGDQGEACDLTRPFHGGIFSIDGSPGGKQIARGFRNPISLRCQHGHDRCFSTELSLDYSTAQGGREKVVEIHSGDDWGFACCATQGVPFAGVTANGVPLPAGFCDNVQAESASFVIGETPFGLEFEPGTWPAPWTGSAFVALHGAFGSWVGARVVAIGTDPTTGAILPASDTDGGVSGALQDFATGWDDGALDHGRPAALTMSPDGRLFLANDNDGDIVWIAPIDSHRPEDGGAGGAGGGGAGGAGGGDAGTD